MTLDADAAAVLRALAADPSPPVQAGSDPLAVRAASDARRKPVTPSPLKRVEDLTVDGPAEPLKARLYLSSAQPSRPPPVLMFFHGGGWVVCSIESHDELCRRIARASGWAVISVDYRRAPEARFPAPLEDCYAATCWAVANAGALGLDPARIAVAGDSSGGNLAAGVTLLARERGGPALLHQVLIYPPVDARCEMASHAETDEARLLTPAAMRWYWSQYLADPADGENPMASPLRAKDLAGLPPATVITAQYDPLCDEAEAYGARLVAAVPGSAVRRYEGVMHGFAGMGAAVAKSEQLVAYVGARLQEVERASRTDEGPPG